MPLRLFNGNTSWDSARKELRFSASGVSADPTHAAQAKPLVAHLAKWNVTDQARRDADDALVDANAVIHALDGRLDREVNQLAARLRFELGGTKADKHPTFRKYFPSPPSVLVRLGLESEIAETKKFATVAKVIPPSKEVGAILKAIQVTEKLGAAALAARTAAEQGVAAVSLQIAAWKDSGNAARRALGNHLDAHAVKNALPRDYSDAFFPPAAERPKKAKSEPKPK